MCVCSRSQSYIICVFVLGFSSSRSLPLLIPLSSGTFIVPGMAEKRKKKPQNKTQRGQDLGSFSFTDRKRCTLAILQIRPAKSLFLYLTLKYMTWLVTLRCFFHLKSWFRETFLSMYCILSVFSWISKFMTGPCMRVRLLPTGLESTLTSVLIWLYCCLFTVGHVQSCRRCFCFNAAFASFYVSFWWSYQQSIAVQGRNDWHLLCKVSIYQSNLPDKGKTG